MFLLMPRPATHRNEMVETIPGCSTSVFAAISGPEFQHNMRKWHLWLSRACTHAANPLAF